jgi:hypothetical protein
MSMLAERKAPIVTLSILIASRLLLAGWLSAVDRGYDKLIAAYECTRDVCEADFDGDGILGRLVIERPTQSESWVVVIDGAQELLRLPREFIDYTFRTHVAIRSEPGGSRLLVFDGTGIERVGGQAWRNVLDHLFIERAVFVWNGQGMSQSRPSTEDREILSAMAARDDAGTWNFWGIYRFLSLPFLIVYYLLMTTILIFIVVRRRSQNLKRRSG